jgi:hypothetical protein
MVDSSCIRTPGVPLRQLQSIPPTSNLRGLVNGPGNPGDERHWTTPRLTSDDEHPGNLDRLTVAADTRVWPESAAGHSVVRPDTQHTHSTLTSSTSRLYSTGSTAIPTPAKTLGMDSSTSRSTTTPNSVIRRRSISRLRVAERTWAPTSIRSPFQSQVLGTRLASRCSSITSRSAPPDLGSGPWQGSVRCSPQVSLVVAALQQVDEPARERIRANAIAKVSAFEKDGKVRVPGVARCIVGTKQDASITRPRDGARSTNESWPTQP